MKSFWIDWHHQGNAMSLTRLALFAYVVVSAALLGSVLGLIPQSWPAQAAEYQSWMRSELSDWNLRAGPIIALTTISMGVLSALLVLSGKKWARWVFLISAIVLFALNLTAIGTGLPPQLMSPLDALLNDISSVLVGVNIALLFLQPSAEGNA